MLRLCILLLAVLVAALGGGQVSTHQAGATFPGANGKIVFNRATSPYEWPASDLNCDFSVNSVDAVIILQIVAGLYSESSLPPSCDLGPMILDNDGDGRLTSIDALLVLQFTADLLHAGNIYTIQPDGSGQTQLTNDPSLEWQPAWSPDGTKIAFSSSRPIPFANWDIFVINADGSGRTRLTTSPASDGNPAWSADGTKIAFTRDPLPDGGTSEIYGMFVMNADGSGQTRLTTDGREPAWSPDGTKIAFTNGVIFVMNADGSGQTNLTNSSGFYYRSPNWSPDGTKIAFIAGSIEGFPPATSDIYVINADGSGRIRLTDTPDIEEDDPTWAPDGAKIAFVSNRIQGGLGIYVMNADGTSVMPLVTSLPYPFGPTIDWQPLPGGR